MLKNLVRSRLRGLLVDEREILLRNRVPDLEDRLAGLDQVGIYIHIPFCEQICSYCPYNKEVFVEDLARSYVVALKREIDRYAGLLGRTPVTSLYIGGGTPTSMLGCGLGDILDHVFSRFNMQCGIHLESHPNHLDRESLGAIKSMGVDNISIGVESLHDRHLATLGRTYRAAEVRRVVERTVGWGFRCVNVDVIFALPGQTYEEVDEMGQDLVAMGVDQVAAYPLFLFPFTPLGKCSGKRGFRSGSLMRRKKMLDILKRHFDRAGFRRSSVWAFTRTGVSKYCSVTVPLYIGLGASGSSYLEDVFFLNTFNVAAYIKAQERGGMPIALSLPLTRKMQMAGWLYWRIYETEFPKSTFRQRFGVEYDEIYGRLTGFLSVLGFLHDADGMVTLTDAGAFWLHALEDLYSIDSISRLWGGAMQEPWPEEVVL